MEVCGPLGGRLGSLLAEEQDGVGEGVTFAETHHHYPKWCRGEEGRVHDCGNVYMHPCVCVCVCVRACVCVTVYKHIAAAGVCVYRHSCCATPSLDCRPLVRDC